MHEAKHSAFSQVFRAMIPRKFVHKLIYNILTAVWTNFTEETIGFRYKALSALM